ncbi:Phosphoesterase [Methylocella tundrae]|uniref:Phosphoesterase n=1 Tax=Methylocella tundrae TaxID=227605 RepID=A0A8B6MCS9_METTU|nr:alkaline phosphatase family protein [Methylocella tundrae]VTZ52018.1 Phosphoesterase [Methylocella tundrae]
MRTTSSNRKSLKDRLLSCVAIGVIIGNTVAPIATASAQEGRSEEGRHEEGRTATPIKHVIIILGENRSFDHIFATYKPVHKGESISNLLSKGIVNADGTPGPNYGEALQSRGFDTTRYQLTPSKTAYSVLPPALVGGPSTPALCAALGVTSGTSCDTPANEAVAKTVENGLPDDYYKYLLTGGTGQTSKTPDKRISYAGRDATHLPPGPYQLTSKTYPYDAYAASPVHRFYQMWQQLDCDASAATEHNSSGCRSDLFPWVETSVGAGSNGAAPPAGFNESSTGEGSTSMGFFNVQQGDAPYFKELADTYSMSDNYHQAVNGGTGANHVMFGAGDAIWFSDGAGNPAVPPHNPVNPAAPGTPLPGYASALSEIENPNPRPGTNNYYTEDGYGGGSGSPTAVAPNANHGGGSYVNCSDATQPGVPAVLNYLHSLSHKIASGCETGHYYLLNNYNPGYFGDGSNAYTDANANNTVFTLPPSNLRTIGDSLNERQISWAYYGDDWNRYLNDKYEKNAEDIYCNICNWAQYSTSIMTNPAVRTEHLKDTTDLYASIAAGKLPAVSYVKPSGLLDGHPGSSKLNLYEGFVKKIVDGVKANPKLWAETAILVTFDEGGGYWDSGYVQPLDFFGDGTRTPMIVVSPYSRGGHISHTYADHASTLKFIEANWGLKPITRRSRDNFPNPRTESDPYVPVNSPAIGDMMDLFNFDHDHDHDHDRDHH